ncbi:50S ribosomal protein L11 methyltransferase [Leptotrichia sp. oral taxon 847]|uniref:50S ribosomal protein L11 methyltransferase n=1 Tax=Leptotrichia sp. oral taxon 847 TaxID=1785996 RepID=UPI0007684013|nr:50S ribosomal protein L11 methyltransferase [Leptotrichia sp. oral taxon 847]AMD95705.1 ribosomal protein L11 methyltransferase [Leptotrichia sp. oral taxon 847]
MKWIKVKIDYFSDNLKETKAKLVNIFEEVGIKQMEFVDYFSDNSLDYSVNFKNKNDIWSIIGYIIYNRFAQTKLNIIYENVNKISKDDKNFMSEIYTLRCSDEEWQDEWKKYFHTVNITPNIVIKPSWDNYEVKGNETVIEIDPGLAFGTGTHETTSLCVEFLEKYAKGKNNLLDIGCGSGILMLIAKKLGVNKVTGIDIDEKVEKVVYENFRKNNIENNYKVVIGNLVDDVSKKYDLVVSNILVDVLIELLKNIEKTLENEATVIFSGILKEKEDIFLKETLKYNLKNIDRNEKNNWVSLVFKYKKI